MNPAKMYAECKRSALLFKICLSSKAWTFSKVKCTVRVQYVGREPCTTHMIPEAAVFSNFKKGDFRSALALNVLVRSIGKEHEQYMILLLLSLSHYMRR